jgi:hypothetical protein
MNEPALRAYLLGKLTESEVELVETRLLDDADLFVQMQVAEDDLFDAFARGALDQDERARFIQRFGADSRRRQFATALSKRTQTTGRVLSFRPRRWLDLAVAATLLITAAAFFIPREPATAPDAPVATAPAATTPAPIAARVSIVLGTSRAAGAPAKVAVTRDATRVDFRIQLNPADRFAQYAVEFRSQADHIVWASGALQASADSGGLALNVVVPADKLPAGIYELAVRGGATASALDDLGFSTLEVSRP